MKDDAVAVAPEVHSVISQHANVRILEVKLKSGAKVAKHWHPQNTSYVVSGGKMKVTKPDTEPIEVELKDGHVLEGVDGYHEIENIGPTDIHTIQVEYLPE